MCPGIVCMGQGAHCSSQLCLHGLIATEQVSSSLLSPRFPVNWLYQSHSASGRMVMCSGQGTAVSLIKKMKIFCGIQLCAGLESQAWPSLEALEAWYAFTSTLEIFAFLKHFKHCLFVVIEVMLVSVLNHHLSGNAVKHAEAGHVIPAGHDSGFNWFKAVLSLGFVL